MLFAGKGIDGSNKIGSNMVQMVEKEPCDVVLSCFIFVAPRVVCNGPRCFVVS